MLRDPFIGGQIVEMDSFYPCIKYKIQADPTLDGTDYFIAAESMKSKWMDFDSERLYCSLSFTCENDQMAFYKLIKVSLQFRIHEESFLRFS